MSKPKRIPLGPEYRRALMRVLKYGKKNAIVSDRLCEELGLPRGRTGESVRFNVIKPMIVEDHVPIGSCGNGYYLISTQEELEENLAALQTRIAGVRARMNGLAKGFQKYKKRRPKR